VANGTAQELRKAEKGGELLKVMIEDADHNQAIQALQALPSVALVDISNGDDLIEVQSKPGASSKREIFKLCVEKGWTLTQMTPVETKLEDIFRELTMK
jgi:ABC-2 type transport system ATP-binding protein